MKKPSKAKIQQIQHILQALFPEPPIPLRHKDPYTLLVAVILSARCTDARVNTITPKLFALADSPQQMITLSYEQIQEIIRPCGLSERKATAIKDMSQILLDCYEGQVPRELEALEALPGVGHKTASVVCCQAFGQPAFPVDTHIYRLARRWGISSAKSISRVEKDLKLAFDEKDWTRLHLQMIYFGRQFCPAIGHVVSKCPICSIIQNR